MRNGDGKLHKLVLFLLACLLVLTGCNSDPAEEAVPEDGDTPANSIAATSPNATLTPATVPAPQTPLLEGTDNQTLAAANVSSILPPSWPDLSITQLSWSPLNPDPGSVVSFNVTVKNMGGQPAAQSRLDYYADNRQVGVASLPLLAAGASVNQTFKWRVTYVRFSIEAVADARNDVAETDEGNNNRRVTFSETRFPPGTLTSWMLPPVTVNATARPDLTVSGISYSPAQPMPYDSVSFNVTITNRGTANASGFIVRCYLNNGPVKHQQSLPALTAGNHTSMSVNWTLPAGNHTFRAVIDEINVIRESNEANNAANATVTGIMLPDLQATGLEWSPLSPGLGDNVTFSLGIRNDSQRPATGFSAALYVDGVKVAAPPIGALGAGVSTSVSLTWRNASPGPHSISARLDNQDQVPESDETNNQIDVTLPEIRLPDLVVEEINWQPLNPAPLDKVDFQIRVRNTGSAGAAASRLKVDIGEVWLNTFDLPQLAANASLKITFRWTAEAGTHQIVAQADDLGLIPEINEVNNRYVALYETTAPPQIDLLITEVELSPAVPRPGQQTMIIVELANYGSRRSLPANLQFSVDGEITDNTQIWMVDGGRTWVTIIYWKAVPGEHDLELWIDAYQQVPEIDESNNRWRKTISVPGG